MLAPGVVAPGVVVPGVVAPGVVAGGAAAAGAAVVTVRVIGAGAGPESPASFTSAAASTPSATAAIAASAAIGARQLGVGRQPRARGGAAAQAPLLVGRERRAAQRAGFVAGAGACSDAAGGG